LAAHLFGRIRILLAAALLRDLFHLLQRGCDLPDSQCLFVTTGAHFIDQHLHFGGAFGDSCHSGGDFFEIGAALGRLRNRFLNQLTCILGGLRASLR
jgi:hypothetical protein